MDEKFSFQFSQSLGIFFKHYYGNISLEEINSSWEYIIENNFIPTDTKGFILDYRDAVINIPPNQSSGIADFYKAHLEVFGGFKIAIITDNPKNVVISYLVNAVDVGYQSKPFSTMQAATAWVLRD
jgi:hypothetical protein